MDDLKKTAALWIGLAALVGFMVFILFLLHNVAAEDRIWARCIYLFGAVQTIALSAVGFFFGKEVNRERAEDAEKRAALAENSAREAITHSIRVDQKVESTRAFAKAKLRIKPNDNDWKELSAFLEQG